MPHLSFFSPITLFFPFRFFFFLSFSFYQLGNDTTDERRSNGAGARTENRSALSFDRGFSNGKLRQFVDSCRAESPEGFAAAADENELGQPPLHSSSSSAFFFVHPPLLSLFFSHSRSYLLRLRSSLCRPYGSRNRTVPRRVPASLSARRRSRAVIT